MSHYAYIEKNFKASSIELIDTANEIIEEYQADGYVLTVRQLYYQLVARDIIANNLKEYKRVAGIFNDARLAGLMDWDAIEDRTREFVRRSRWLSGAHAMRSIADQFHMDMWQGQPSRVFVIVEKEALIGVFERVCNEWDIPVLAARGYPSVSVVRSFVESDILPTIQDEQRVHILHFGDHDPSGIDMSRDLKDRFNLFLSPSGDDYNYDFTRCALNMSQVEEQKPPENPAKSTDSRFASYVQQFGRSSWELDALNPQYLTQLVTDELDDVIDLAQWQERSDEIEAIRRRMYEVGKEL